MKQSFLLLLCCIFIACSEDSSIEPTIKNEFYPMQIGNEWSYQSISNNVKIGYIIQNQRDTILLNNEKWVVAMYVNSIPFIFTNRADGLYEYDKLNEVARLQYKYPVKMNDVFIDGFNDTVKVAGIDVMVTVPAGTFYCYRYLRTNEKNEEDEIYYAKGIGEIKIIHFTAPDSKTNKRELKSTTELRSYNFKK